MDLSCTQTCGKIHRISASVVKDPDPAGFEIFCRIRIMTLMQIRIQLFTLMRIRMRIQLPKIMGIHADLDSQPCLKPLSLAYLKVTIFQKFRENLRKPFRVSGRRCFSSSFSFSSTYWSTTSSSLLSSCTRPYLRTTTLLSNATCESGGVTKIFIFIYNKSNLLSTYHDKNKTTKIICSLSCLNQT